MAPRRPLQPLALRARLALRAATVLVPMGCAASDPDAAGPPAAAMYRGDPAHTGVYATRPVTRLGGLQWRFQTEGPVRSTPVVADGVVYVGSGDGHLYALERETGALRWRFDAGSSVASSPAVTGDLVVFGGRDGSFFALEKATGRPRWRVETGPELPLPWGHESADLWTSSPVVAGERILFGAGDGKVYAVERATGRVEWSAQTEGRVRSTPAVADDLVVVGSVDGRVYVLELESGRIVRRMETEGASLSSGEFGFDRRSIPSSPAVVGGRAFVGAKDGYLYAFDIDDGSVAWRADHRVSWILGGPAVADGVVYDCTSDGRFAQAVSVESGEELWRVATPLACWSSPSVAGGVVYVTENAGTVLALDRRNGNELWRYRSGDRAISSPVPDDGLLFFGSDDGGVYALRDGDPVHRAVYWDSTLVRAGWYQGHEALRDYLEARGYEVVSAPRLGSFLEQRLADGEPSVVVFALDALPEAVAAGGEASLLRRYLEAGGKAVWVGMPPLLWPRDSESGRPVGLDAIRRDAPGELLGVAHDRGNFDPYGATPTPEGRRWGLDRWWRAQWAATPGPDLTVLAEDEHGLAAAWVRSYRGAPGTGFVRLWGSNAPMPDPLPVHVAAEYRPAR